MKRMICLALGVLMMAGWPAPASGETKRAAKAGSFEWLTFGGNPQRSGEAHVRFNRLPAKPAWTFRPGKGQWAYRRGVSVWTSPAIAQAGGGWRVYIGSYDHHLYCLDALTGRELWAFTAGDGVFSCPVIAETANGRLVIFGSADRTIYAVNATDGTRKWAFETFPWKDTVLPARVSSGLLWQNKGRAVVFFGVSYSDRSWRRKVQEGYLFSLNAETGRELWRKKLTGTYVTSPCLGPGGETAVYVACQDGTIWKLRADTGKEVWRFTANEMVCGSVSVLDVQGRPAVLFGTRQNSVYAVDCATGQRVGKFRAGYWVDATPARLRLPDGSARIVFGAYDRGVYALDSRTLEVEWKIAAGNWVSASPLALAGPGGPAVAISSLDGALYLFDGRTGRKLWHFNGGACIWTHVLQGDAVWASPAAVQMGRRALLLFPSYSYQVHGFILDSEFGRSSP